MWLNISGGGLCRTLNMVYMNAWTMLEMCICSEILIDKAIGAQTNRNMHFANYTCKYRYI